VSCNLVDAASVRTVHRSRLARSRTSSGKVDNPGFPTAGSDRPMPDMVTIEMRNPKHPHGVV
jgi:hypothetical protein